MQVIVGRCVTQLAYDHLGMKNPAAASPEKPEQSGQQSLF